MGQGMAEKLSRHCYVNIARKARRWHKRYTAKLRRQAERRNIEDAPNKCIKGWYD
jgi:hypothetical protein